MNYQKLIDQNIGNVYQAGIATKIIQHITRIRNSSDKNQARRWVMELLQNARDVAWPDSMVNVKIELTDEVLKFAHTGKAFRVKDILSIVNQVSSKTDDKNTVGQFGTGFVTTFQLSELVRLEGVLKDEGLPYKPFVVDIDRRGNTKDEVLAGITQAMDSLREVDSTESLTEYNQEAFHTVFTYALENENSRNIAQIGMEDLKETIFFVLLFSKKIGSVELNYRTAEKTKSICYRQGSHKKLGDNLYIAEFFCTIDHEEIQKYAICYMEKDGMTLAANFSEEQGFLPMSEDCARIFIDFPLIGAEKFCFPLVINDLELQPNEPRSGISLVDNPNSKDAQINKKLIDKAVSNYRDFLSEAQTLSLKGLENIIKIPVYEPSKEMSEQWVKSHVYKKIYQFCASLPILETANGKQALNRPNSYLLKAETTEILNGLKNLLTPVTDMYYAIDETDWYETFAAYEPEEEKIYSLKKLLADAETFIRTDNKIDTSQKSIVEWCEEVCKLAWKEEELARKIRAGEIAIFPSQKLQDGKVWHLKKITEIRIDPGIPEVLKDVTEILDDMPPYYEDINTKKCCIRENLLHKQFVGTEIFDLMTYEWIQLGNYIETKSYENFRILNEKGHSAYYQKIRCKAWILLLSCGLDKEMYDMFAQFSNEDIPKYEFYETPLKVGVWKNAYHGLLKLIINEIQVQEKLENLRWYKSEKCQNIYAWLNLFYNKWLIYQHSNENSDLRIYVDQKGNFKRKSDLAWDKIEQKALKNIAYGLREQSKECHIYEKLMHEKIQIPNLYLTSYEDKTVAIAINQAVTQLLAQKNLADASEEQQEACSSLLVWIQNNPKEAEQYFAMYCTQEGMMKLLTPKEAVRMQKKIHKLEKMLQLIGVEDEDMAIQMLSQMIEKNTSKGFVLTNDVLIDEDLYYDLLRDADEEKIRKVCHEIGVAGERYVFAILKQYYEEQGLTIVSESTSEIKLESKEKDTPRNVTITYLDNASYHQAGWDISVTDSANDGETDYIEVKTHTKKSYLRRKIQLSNEQMKFAISKRAHYHVIVALYNYYEKKGEEVNVYDNFLTHIQSGKLKNVRDGYEFCI